MVTKDVLRNVYLEKRLSLSHKEYDDRNARIRQNFNDFTQTIRLSSVHIFLPIVEKKEVNTWPIIHDLRQQHRDIGIFTSKVLSNGHLEHYRLNEDTPLIVNRWGIPEPENQAPVEITEIDAIVTPLIISDKHGNRIGYGKGYYDRFFAQVRSSHRIGISLGPTLDQIPYNEAHDIPLTCCIGPWFTLNF